MQSLCWIQGFYIYKDVQGHVDEFHAYGMPRDPDKGWLLAYPPPPFFTKISSKEAILFDPVSRR